jgi:hypothetical protein
MSSHLPIQNHYSAKRRLKKLSSAKLSSLFCQGNIKKLSYGITRFSTAKPRSMKTKSLMAVFCLAKVKELSLCNASITRLYAAKPSSPGQNLPS